MSEQDGEERGGRQDRPIACDPAPRDEPHLIFDRGGSYPKAISWFGISSFWGHLRHLAASVIATEDIDARDWMHADSPEDLTARIARHLEPSVPPSTATSSVTECIDRDVWVDFLADTGDDSEVSHAVADMLFQPYEVPDPIEGKTMLVPRGDILMFGGDTAYPVATQMEIHNRVCVPFARALKNRQDGRPRVLLGIPGNHDWYDGLDGFARMFRQRRGTLDARATEADSPKVDRGGQLGHFIDWVEAFRVGRFVTKREALPIAGYKPLQNASYFAVKLAPHLDWWGVDRQLRSVDYTQRSFFSHLRAEHPDDGLIVCVADPAQAMLEPHPTGRQTLSAIHVDLERDGPLVLTGDTHHYCRQELGQGMHVIAGGGGAFLHPARMDGRGKTKAPEAEFPGPRASFALAMQVPWQIAAGRSGFLIHTLLGVLYAPILLSMYAEAHTSLTAGVIGVGVTMACALLGGWRQRHPFAIGSLAALYGVWVAGLPAGVQFVISQLPVTLGTGAELAVVALFAIYLGSLGFGTYLMVLTLLGLERHQAFSALAHPGYKHFVRLRIHKDGRHVDGWVIGKVDTLDPSSPTVLVDRFRWTNPFHRQTPPQGGVPHSDD